ncbi:MAG: MmgE/PrpD family protein [Gemmataceae bacterium]|nr:MmgE/PrpD family protein [Gemmataceae bacterium]
MTAQQTTTGSDRRVEDPLEHLLDFVGRTTYDDLPMAVRSQAVRVARDTVGVILGGSLEPEPRKLGERLRGADGSGEATILGPGFPRTSAPLAALVNGTAGTFLELDEYHRPRGHAAVHVLPAVLALGERLHIPGTRIVEALVLGYEVGARACRACSLRPAVHDHGHLGTLGAVVGCGKLLGFGPADLRQAVQVASCLGLASPWRTAVAGATVRNMFAGVGSQIGMLAAEATASGFTGLPDGIEVVFDSILGESFNADQLVDGLGAEYEIATSCFKFNACCASTHPAVEATLDLLRRHAPRPEDVVAVRVATHRLAARLDDREPANQLAAKFSIAFAVATTLRRGVANRAAFAPEAVADPETRALAGRIEVVADPEFTDRHPAEAVASVELRLADGRTLSELCALASGDGVAQASEAELEAKFDSLAGPLFPGSACSAAAAALDRLEEYADIGELTAQLARLARADAGGSR